MQIALCDDDIFCRTHVLKLLNEYITAGNHNISVTVFEHAEDLLEDALKIGGYDIYLLDVMMPDTDGIQLGLALREAGLDGKILYLTSSEEYALDAFRAKASNYILKPAKKETLFPALDELLRWISTRTQKSILVKTKDNSIKLPYNSILYANTNKRAIAFHLINDQVIESSSIRISFTEAVQELLQDSCFVLCGASMIVNLRHITAVESEALVFKNGTSVYISKRISKEIRMLWQDYGSADANS